MELVGFVNKKGNYEGRDYHNIMLHCVSEANNNNGMGHITEVVKVKYEKLNECFGKPTKVDDLIDLIGNEISCSYDKFGTVNHIRIIEQ